MGRNLKNGIGACIGNPLACFHMFFTEFVQYSCTACGFIADNFTASVSYDFNLSKLRTASSTMGGLEIAAAYVFGNTGKKDPLKCPAY